MFYDSVENSWRETTDAEMVVKRAAALNGFLETLVNFRQTHKLVRWKPRNKKNSKKIIICLFGVNEQKK